MNKSSSYSQIAKATGIFGGVQVINILISFTRSKFVAILLGTTGIGVLGMFTNTINIVSSITNLGITFSAVRTISEASATNNESVISHTVITFRRWTYFTAIFGAVITIVLANQLSIWNFDNEQYTSAFIWLSIALLLQALNSGQLILLQGMQKLKQLAKANVFGSIIGLFLSLPLYYYLGFNGILPAIILTIFINLIFSYYFSMQVGIRKVSQTFYTSFIDGISMVKLGSIMMLSGFVTTGVVYLIRIYISQNGGLKQVGLYTAAWSILNGYVSMIFTAMGTDYFPRLSAVHQDNIEIKRLVNEQAEVAILILGPILILFSSILPEIVQLLFTSEFLPIVSLIQWALIGIFFKAASWSIAFIILAKGDKKIFLISEISINVIILLSNIIFYRFFKLAGIGSAFSLSYLIYLILILLIVRTKYNFSFARSFVKLFFVQLSLTSLTLLLALMVGFPYTYLIGSLMLIISLLYTYHELKSRIDFKSVFR